jgi:hypothetical protein
VQQICFDTAVIIFNFTLPKQTHTMKKILLILLSALSFVLSKAQVLNTSFCQTNGTVYAVAIDSAHNTVYIGGSFTTVCGSPRSRIAALNLTTGALLTWTATVNSDVRSMYVYNNALYIGGFFTSVNSQSRANAAKFYIPGGTLASWSPGITVGTTVSSITAYKNKVYLGGSFLLTVATGQNLCELDTGTAAATSWSDANLNGTVSSVAVNNGALYVAGSYTNIASSGINYLSKFYLSGSGNTLSSWDVQGDAQVTSVLPLGSRVFIGGSFSFLGGGTLRAGLACVDSGSAVPDSWDPGVNNNPTSLVYRNGMIYPVGNYTMIDNKTRYFISAIDVNTGIASKWDIQANSSVVAAATTSNQIFVGGSMTSVLGATRNYFAVICINPIDTITNAPDGPASICAGVNGVTYSITPVSGATSYTWQYDGGGATIHGNSNVVTIDFSSSATAGTLSVQATNGCETSNTQTLSISTYTFDVNISTGANPITCGDSTQISVGDNYQGSGTLSYSWSPSTGLDVSNASQVMSGTKITRMYTVTATSTEGCSAKDTVTIEVNPFNLTASSSFGTILCSTKDTLHAVNQYAGPGAVTYTWSPSSGLSNPHAANPTGGPVVSTDYTLTASVNGCSGDPQIVSIQVNPISLSAGNTSGGTIVCGESTQLSESDNYPGAGTLTFTWSPSTGLSNANIVNPTANPITNTTYTLTMNSPEGCVSTDYTTISVNSLDVSVTNSYSVNCNQPVTLNTNANTSNPNVTYSWTPSVGLSSTTSANPTATVSSNTIYNVTISLPASGCADATNSISLTLLAPMAPQICMVTVDSASTHNVIYWDKTGMSAIDSFRIYREITTNNYQPVGSVQYNALSEFHDYGADPNVTTYRYKLTALDSCGNESPLSNYHNTIYIVSNNNGQYTWNPGYTIENSPNPVNNYLLMRDDNNTGAWHQVASTTGSQNTIVDPQYSTYQATANWQVVTAWNISCTPTARQSNGTMSTIVRSKSNISNNRTTVVRNNNEGFSVYPNPTSGNLNINFQAGISGAVTIKIVSLLGEEIYSETLSSANGMHAIDMSKLQNGVYLIQMSSANGTVIKRVMKN